MEMFQRSWRGRENGQGCEVSKYIDSLKSFEVGADTDVENFDLPYHHFRELQQSRLEDSMRHITPF
jgi:hypothetical protein